MKQSNSIYTRTFRAAGAVVAHRLVTMAGAQATTQGEKVMGASAFDVDDTKLGVAEIIGTTVVEAGAAIGIGDSLITDSAGRAIPVTGNLAVTAGATAVTSSAANGEILEGADLPEFVFADALESASAAGEFIEVLLRR